VLDPLCEAAPDKLTDGGTMVVVHSEFAGVEQSVVALRSGAPVANVVASQWIQFGPVFVISGPVGWKIPHARAGSPAKSNWS